MPIRCRRAGAALGFSLWLACASLCLSARAQQPPPAPAPLSSAQVRALVQRAIQVQHVSDEALEVYDRTERVLFSDRDHSPSETVSRAVPTGTGLMRVEFERDGVPASAAQIAQAWKNVAAALQSRASAATPDVKKDFERAARRKRDVAKMVDAMGDAFTYRWAGRQLRNGRPTIELTFEPAPEFKSSLRFAAVYRQIWGRVWIDEATGGVARIEAQLRHDVPIVAGIAGKVYAGSRAELEQAEVAPGIWLPTLSSFDVEGRKFLFPASFHRKIYASGYRRIGPPAEALALIRSEHAPLFASGR